jgi:hypothetical protein
MYIENLQIRNSNLDLLELFTPIYRVGLTMFNIMAVSFIEGGKRSTRRKPPTLHKSLTKTLSHSVVSPGLHLAIRHERGSFTQLKW